MKQVNILVPDTMTQQEAQSVFDQAQVTSRENLSIALKYLKKPDSLKSDDKDIVDRIMKKRAEEKALKSMIEATDSSKIESSQTTPDK